MALLRNLILFAAILVGCLVGFSTADGEGDDGGERKKRGLYGGFLFGGCRTKCGYLAHCSSTSRRCVCNSGCSGDPILGCHYNVVHHCGTLAHWDSLRFSCICNTGCSGDPWLGCRSIIVSPRFPSRRIVNHGSGGNFNRSSRNNSGSGSSSGSSGSSGSGSSSGSSSSSSGSSSGSSSKERRHSRWGNRSSRSAGDSDEKFD